MTDSMEKHLIINIGRQFGSGGKAIAMELGRKLGIKVYDSELISQAAEESGLSESLFQKNDEKKSFLKIGSIFGSRFGGFASNSFNDEDLFRIQSETIRKIADEGSAIFVGRASNYILRELDSCLDVFISAPAEVRAARVAEREGLSEEDAKAMVLRKDHSRKVFHNFFTCGENWGVASNYDLCIDSSVLGIEKTADFIIDFGKAAGKL